MCYANGFTTHMLSSCKLYKHGSSLLSDPHQYMYIVRDLQYVTLTIIYITFSVNRACQFVASLFESRWSIVKIILW